MCVSIYKHLQQTYPKTTSIGEERKLVHKYILYTYCTALLRNRSSTGFMFMLYRSFKEPVKYWVYVYVYAGTIRDCT